MIGVIAAFIIGIICGVMVRSLDDENCPREVLHYNCKGSKCDHSEVELRRAQLAMALNHTDPFHEKDAVEL